MRWFKRKDELQKTNIILCEKRCHGNNKRKTMMRKGIQKEEENVSGSVSSRTMGVRSAFATYTSKSDIIA